MIFVLWYFPDSVSEQDNNVCHQVRKGVDGIRHQGHAVSQYTSGKFKKGHQYIGNHANNNGSDSCGHSFTS
jgi:hypothetical protein